ncbi:hypothetical protein TUM4438_44290 [Shewanella sairae]|uniref:DUF202 domain-containing protein n=1 Tax=Shewanella sairae TaxID=190310 RepID=A0ABQ4PRP2_9GAMM|nr:hypothetical protein [Shewanella sairae]MCL1130390.1 hypothetical protein [Shewanella sairae]GIU52203.1 hypothetical protein TUM4438_44290 [Shewanella sairae]
MYYKYMDATKIFKQQKFIRFIRLSSMLFAVAMLVYEVQQERTYSWYFAFLYGFFLIPSLYFTDGTHYRRLFHMRDVINPLRIFTTVMAIIYLMLYIHQAVVY